MLPSMEGVMCRFRSIITDEAIKLIVDRSSSLVFFEFQNLIIYTAFIARLREFAQAPTDDEVQLGQQANGSAVLLDTTSTARRL